MSSLRRKRKKNRLGQAQGTARTTQCSTEVVTLGTQKHFTPFCLFSTFRVCGNEAFTNREQKQ